MNTSHIQGLDTHEHITWCPACPDHMIFKSIKLTIDEMMHEHKLKQTDFAMVADVGCNGKMFDYLNLSGIYSLHGRALPVGIGMTIGNPNLRVLVFAGDGAAYAEGMSHFIHAFKYNANMTMILHDNQSFSLTTGQPSPTTQQGYEGGKSKPQGEESNPLNPIMLALAAGASFIARVNAREIHKNVPLFKQAINHQGFAFIEVIQDCLVFNKDANNKDERMYYIKDNTKFDKALSYAQEYNYNTKQGKIPMGILYQNKNAPDLAHKWRQLTNLQQKKKCFADFRK